MPRSAEPFAPGGYPTPASTMPIAGSTPDYGSLLLSDPAYTSWASGAASAIGGADAVRRAAARALAVNYGGLPAGFQDVYGDLDAATLAQAAANPESQQAQIQRSYQQAQQQLQTGLAARGALHSGDLVQGQSALDTQLGTNLYNAAQAFQGDYASQAVNPYLDVYNAQMGGRAGAVQAAETNVENLYPQTPPGTGTLVDNWQSLYGQPVYDDGSGNLYSIDSASGSLVPYNQTPTSQQAMALLDPGYAYDLSQFGAYSVPGVSPPGAAGYSGVGYTPGRSYL